MNRIKELRKEKKATQQEVADAMGITRRGFQKWENGESNIKANNAQQLAEYFGVSVGYLLGFNVEHPSENEIEFHNEVMDGIKKEAFIRFLDYLSLSGTVLSDKQIQNIFNHLQDLSDLNGQYQSSENDSQKLENIYSIWKNYIPNRELILNNRSSYTEDIINTQLELYKRIIEGTSSSNE